MTGGPGVVSLSVLGPSFLEGRPTMEALTALRMRLAVHAGFVIGACWRGAVGPIPLGENADGGSANTIRRKHRKGCWPRLPAVLELRSKPSEE
jgi:hypothetical protein